MSDGNSGSDKIHTDTKPKHVDASEALLNGAMGLGWQGLLIGKGLVAGGLAEARNELKMENIQKLSTQGGMSAGIGALAGYALASKREMLQVVLGGVGLVGGIVYGKITWDKYSSNKELGKALDAVYKQQDWTTFNKQTKVAEKVLGKEGFDAGFTGLTGFAGSVGMGGAMFFGKGILSKELPAVAECIYGKSVGDKLSKVAQAAVRTKVSESPFNRDLNSFVNKVSHGDVHVARSAERSKPFVFDKDNRISNISIQKEASASDIQRQIIVGSVADRIGRDKTALEIAIQGSEKANYHAPREGDMERAASEGVAFAESQIGQLRKIQGAQRYAIEGSEAYCRQQSGNEYSQYLRKVHGGLTTKGKSEAKSLVMNVPIADTADAFTHRLASENLAGLGIRPSDRNLAAAKNTYIQQLDDVQKQKAIRAVSYYLEGHPSNSKSTAADRIATLDKLASGLNPRQVDLITARIPDFDPQYFPHHLFEGPVVSSVESLVSGGFMNNATQAHKLLCKLAGQSNQQKNVEAAELLINCAKNVGMSEERLVKKGISDAGARILKEMLSLQQESMILDLAIALKHLEGATRYHDAFAVNTMRGLGFKAEDITAEQIAKYVGGMRRP